MRGKAEIKQILYYFLAINFGVIISRANYQHTELVLFSAMTLLCFISLAQDFLHAKRDMKKADESLNELKKLKEKELWQKNVSDL